MKRTILEGGSMTSVSAAHQYLQQQLHFPDYYGGNLDALWDLLTSIGEPLVIEIRDLPKLHEYLGEYADVLISVFESAAQENQNVRFSVITSAAVTEEANSAREAKKGTARMKTGRIYSISISPERGQLKREVGAAELIANFGIENDGHAGDWGRQVTCLSWESVQQANVRHGLQAGPGDFAENILIEKLDLTTVKAGDRLQLGESAVLEVSQVGKVDHPSVVTRTLGTTLLPYEGLFCRVLKGGSIRKGDVVKILA